MTKKMCILCGERPAAVPDRERMGRPIKRVCHECHGLRLRGDIRAILDYQTGRQMKTYNRIDVEPLLKDGTWAAVVFAGSGESTYVRWRRCGFKTHTEAAVAAKAEAMDNEQHTIILDDGVDW